MKNHWHDFWHARTPGEKMALALTFAVAAAVLYAWLVQSTTEARTRLQVNVVSLRAQSAQLEQQSAEYARLRSTPVPTVAQTDFRTLIQTQADAAGLAQALIKINVQDVHRLQLTFGATSFAAWLDWAQALQLQQIRIEAARIEALSTPGLVSVTATLARSPSQ
jgi:type II secretory pathway component PulM